MLPAIGINAGIGGGISDAKVNVVTGAELDVTKAHSDLITGGIGLTWRLFDGLKMFVTYEKLKKLEEISELSARITIENTVARIITGYHEIVKQGTVQEILAEQVKISEFRLELARMRYETGTGSEMEYLKARVELNADVSNYSNQRTLYENSKTTLNELLSRDVNTPFSVIDTIIAGDTLNIDTLRKGLLNSNTHLLLSVMNRKVGELDVRNARANQFPTLDFYAGYNYYRNETEANFIKYNRNYGPSVALTLNMKLFDGLNLTRQFQNASISFQSYETGVKQMQNRLEAYLSRIYNEYRNQLEMVGFERENLQLAIRNMDIAKDSYAIGAISSLQLREVQEDLLFARSRLISAQFKVKLTETELLLLSGRLVE
jgi:outer membrane protein TolC